MTTAEYGAWLTAARVERLSAVLRAVRSQLRPGMTLDQAPRTLWKTCGGPLDDTATLVDVLLVTELLTVRDGRLRTTRSGQQIATQDHQHGGTLLARALIRAGHFASQSRSLGELGTVDTNTGTLTCRRGLAIAAAPQLIGVLRRFPTVTFADALIVPVELARELVDTWTIPGRVRQEDSRKSVGNRGELYSYRYEQMRATDSSKIRWVALDDETLGYDIEDLNAQPRRQIEAKASTGAAVRFILSANEWKVAHRKRHTYEVQFWGGVNLGRSPRDDYDRLRKAGFPLVYRDIPKSVADGSLTAKAAEYILTVSQ